MNLVSISINPAPSGAIVTSFDGYDGAKLRTALWQPTRGPARGTVCIFQGRGEFIEKYFEVVADLRRRGFAVAALDWRGQGGSQRPLANPFKGHVVGFTEYDRDLAKFMNELVLPALPPPYIALAHSMGGNILLRNAQMDDSWFERMVVVSPMIEVHESQGGAHRGWARFKAEAASMTGFATAYIPGGDDTPEELLDFNGNDLTSDRVRWERNKAVLEQAPALGLGSPTIGWAKSAMRSCALLQKPGYPKDVTVPMLLFSAGADRIVSATAIEDFAVDVKIGGHIPMPASRHEILQENDAIRQRFWAAFDAYMGIAIPTVAKV